MREVVKVALLGDVCRCFDYFQLFRDQEWVQYYRKEVKKDMPTFKIKEKKIDQTSYIGHLCAEWNHSNTNRNMFWNCDY